MFSVFWSRYPGEGLLGHMVTLFLKFEEPPYVFLNSYTSLHSHQQWMRVSFSPQPLQHLLLFVLIIAILTSSHISHGHLYGFLGEVSVQIFCPLSNWIVCLLGVELYEFFIYFGYYCLVRYFAHLPMHLPIQLVAFLSVVGSFAVQKPFSLI